MHIRHLVCTDNFAGVERLVASSAVELARRGHTVDVIGGAPAAMRPLLEPAGVDHVAAASTVAVARAAARRGRCDVIHAHMTAADVAAVLSRPFVRAPIVSTLHFAQPRGHDTLTRALYRLIPRLVTTQVAISRTVADAVGDPGVRVIVNGVEPPGARPVGPDGDALPRERVVLVAQRLEGEKDTATAVRAFAASGLADQGWELHIAGEGAQRTELLTLVERLGLAHQVRLIGRVDDLDERMWRAGIFVATATREPFGLSVVEAMAHGLPVVATHAGGHRETMGSATPETLFDPGDADAAGALLAGLAADPAGRDELGERGRARWEAAFTIAAHVDALEALYRDVIAG